MLDAQGLRKRFGAREVVCGVGFRIGAGEIYGLLGPNGAGKTTTISMLTGVLKRDGGSVHVDGIDLDEGPPARRRIGLVPQAITLYQDLTARENLFFWGRMYELRGKVLREAVEEGLAAVGLAERAGDRVATFSGGMQRRLNLAAGLLHGPALLTLDEPTAGVDPQSRSAIFELLERLRERGMAILYTTHYMEEAERLCDRIGIIDGGRLIAEGTRRQLVDRLGEHVRIELGFAGGRSPERAEAIARNAAGVRAAHRVGERLVVFADDGSRRVPGLLAAMLDAGLAPTHVEVVEPDLEDVFLTLTGRALRD
jgi:linearmycin/streptolysin S transport system ATP-binding protein